MIWHTVDQAARRVYRHPEAIRRWIREGHLTAYRNPIDGRRYVEETALLAAERAARARKTDTQFTDVA